MKSNSASWNYNRIMVLFLALSAILMMLFDVFGADHFIGYIDGEAYYSYLPEYFLKGNWDYFEKYPIGTAVCQLPFFLAAHILTLLTDPGQADGYTLIYDWAVGIGGIVYYLMGTWFLYRVLGRILPKKWAFGSILLLTAGTALPLYATKYAAFSHIKTYAILSVLMYLMMRIVNGEEDGFRIHFFCGLLAGLLVVIRNINAFLLLFYVLYGLGCKEEWREHRKKMFSVHRLLPNLLGAGLLIGLQMILWKIATGHFICYSYQGESFSYLSNPQITETLFSDAKGLLIFSPVLIFSVLGMFFLKKTGCKKFCAGVVVLFALELYTTSAWWCWWLGGVYSIRSFVDIFPVLAIPVGAFFCWLESALEHYGKATRKIWIVFYAGLTLFFCLVNFAFMKGVLDGSVNETMAFWWELQEALKHVFDFR